MNSSRECAHLGEGAWAHVLLGVCLGQLCEKQWDQIPDDATSIVTQGTITVHRFGGTVHRLKMIRHKRTKEKQCQVKNN